MSSADGLPSTVNSPAPSVQLASSLATPVSQNPPLPSTQAEGLVARSLEFSNPASMHPPQGSVSQVPLVRQAHSVLFSQAAHQPLPLLHVLPIAIPPLVCPIGPVSVEAAAGATSPVGATGGARARPAPGASWAAGAFVTTVVHCAVPWASAVQSPHASRAGGAGTARALPEVLQSPSTNAMALSAPQEALRAGALPASSALNSSPTQVIRSDSDNSTSSRQAAATQQQQEAPPFAQNEPTTSASVQQHNSEGTSSQQQQEEEEEARPQASPTTTSTQKNTTQNNTPPSRQQHNKKSTTTTTRESELSTSISSPPNLSARGAAWVPGVALVSSSGPCAAVGADAALDHQAAPSGATAGPLVTSSVVPSPFVVVVAPHVADGAAATLDCQAASSGAAVGPPVTSPIVPLLSVVPHVVVGAAATVDPKAVPSGAIVGPLVVSPSMPLSVVDPCAVALGASLPALVLPMAWAPISPTHPSSPLATHRSESAPLDSVPAHPSNTSEPTLPILALLDGIDWRAEQERDPDCILLHKLLQNPNDPSIDRQQHRQLLSIHKEIKLDSSGRLVRYVVDEATQRKLEQLVVPLSLRQALLQAHHESPTAGHLGIRSTYLRLRERYFWVSMRADVEQWVRSCRLCSARQYSTNSSPGNLQPVLVHYIGQLWAMDVVGPLPITANGNRFILVAVEYLTGWPEAWALPATSAETVMECIIDLISRHGVPERLLTDNAKNFISEAVTTLCSKFNIQKIQTTTYHPQGNGKVERLNQTITNVLSKLCRSEEFSDSWDMALPFALFSIRSAVSSTTQYSPFYLLHGYDMRTPIDNAANAPHPTWVSPDSYASELTTRLQLARTKALQHLEQVRLQQKKRFDSQHKPLDIRPGDLVMLRTDSTRSKFDDRFTGPYTVLQQTGPVTYLIQLSEDKPLNVNIDRLKLYHPSPLRSGSDTPLFVPASPSAAASTAEQAVATTAPAPTSSVGQQAAAPSALSATPLEATEHTTPPQSSVAPTRVPAHRSTEYECLCSLLRDLQDPSRSFSPDLLRRYIKNISLTLESCTRWTTERDQLIRDLRACSDQKSLSSLLGDIVNRFDMLVRR